MKIIVIGDIHGRDVWKSIIEQEPQADHIIFIGDYLDSFDVGVNKQIKNFKEILYYKKNNFDKVTLLLGNHDYHYLPECIARRETYSGFKNTISRKGSQLVLDSILNNEIIGCKIIDDFLFSHAGITSTWCTNNYINTKSLESDINQAIINRRSIFGFAETSPLVPRFSNPYGDDKYQGPLWVRPKSLITDQLPGYTHIVGHTVHDSITKQGGVYFIDCLDNSLEYLLIDSGNVTIKQIK